MSRDALEELRGELEDLRRRHDEELAEQLRDARAYGNDSNNDEYHAVREEQMVLEARIALLEHTVDRAVVVEPDSRDDVAVIGSMILVEDVASGKRSLLRLASAHSLAPDGVSAASPLGQALVGATPGAVVTVEVPRGRSRSVRLISVQRSN